MKRYIATLEPIEDDQNSRKYKGRHIPTAEEADYAMRTMNTKGRKGLKLPRINMAFTPENHDYIVTMSRVSGKSATDFVNKIISEHRRNHLEAYEQACEFRKAMKQ